jgi:hypothetical protein
MRESAIDKPALIERLATRIRERGLTAPAILAIELLRPLGFVGSQLVLMFGPLFGAVGTSRYADYAGLLEDRQAMDQLVATLETSTRAAQTPGRSAPPPADGA